MFRTARELDDAAQPQGDAAGDSSRVQHDFSTIPVYPESEEEADVSAEPDRETEEEEEEDEEDEEAAGDDEAGEPTPGHEGKRIVYGDLGDRINTFFARLTNREFRKRFREWKDSPDRYFIQQDRKAKDLLIDAEPAAVGGAILPGTESEHHHFDVKYRRVGLDIDIPLPQSDRRLPSPKRTKGRKRGWGMANRMEQENGFHVLSFGIGDYNRYNMLGGEQKGKKIHPYRNALIGYIGRSKDGKPPAFIAIGVGLRKGGGWVSTPQSRKTARERWRKRWRKITRFTRRRGRYPWVRE